MLTQVLTLFLPRYRIGSGQIFLQVSLDNVGNVMALVPLPTNKTKIVAVIWPNPSTYKMKNVNNILNTIINMKYTSVVHIFEQMHEITVNLILRQIITLNTKVQYLNILQYFW